MSSIESGPNAHISGSAVKKSDEVPGRNKVTDEVSGRANRACDRGSAACRFTGVKLVSTADGGLDVTLRCGAGESCEVTNESLQGALDRLVQVPVNTPTDSPKPYTLPINVAI